MPPSGDSNDPSVFCWLEPRNATACEVLAFNRGRAGRVARLSTEFGRAVEMLKIRLEEPKQRRGLVMFGRHPGCSIEFPKKQISLDHCYIDLNPQTGVLILHNTSRHYTTWLDNEQVMNPPCRAMLPHHTHCLRVHAATFQIRWPEIAQDALPLYQSRILSLAKRLQAASDTFDLTDLEFDLSSLPPTAPATAPGSRHLTPAGEQRKQGPIKMEELGRGTYGIVWKAVDRITGEFVAVKQLRKGRDTTLLKREILHMHKLHHVRPLFKPIIRTLVDLV